MNQEELKQILENAFTGNNNEDFFISGDELQSNTIGNMFANFFDSQALSIKNGGLQIEGEVFIIAGGTLDTTQHKFLLLDNPPVEARFSIVDNNAEVSIKLFGFSSTWKLSGSFPPLADTIADNLVYSDASFLLSSIECEEAETEKDGNIFKNGLSFESQINFDESLSMLATLLNTSGFTFSGPVQIGSRFSSLELCAPEGQEITLGPFSFTFRCELSSRFAVDTANETDSSLTNRTSMNLVSKLDYNSSGKNLSLPIIAKIEDPEFTYLYFESDTSQISELGLEEVSGLLGNTSFTVGDVIQLDSMVLDKVMLEVSVPRMSLAGISARLAVNKELDIIPELIKLSDLAVLFSIEFPFGTSRKDLYVDLSGTVSLDDSAYSIDGKIEGLFSLPQLAYQCRLAAGGQVDISSFMERVLPLKPDIPTMICTGFNITGNVKDKSYSLFTAIQNEWTISFGGKSFILKNISFALESTETQTDVQVNTNLTLAGMDVSLLGFVTSSLEEKGWLFSGGLESREPVRLSALVNDILPVGFQIPQEILDIELTAGSVTLDTIENAFSMNLTTSSRVSFGTPGSLETTAVSIACGANNWSIDVSGRLQVMDILDINGTLAIQKKGTQTTLTFTPEPGTTGLEITLPLPETDNGPPSLKLEIGTTSLAKSQSGWGLSTMVQVSFQNFSTWVQDILPATSEGILKAGGNWVSLTISRLVEAAELNLPVIGTLYIDIDNFSVTLGQDVALAADLGIGLPEALNSVFGTGENGEPRFKLFRTYDPATKQTPVNLRLSADKAEFKFVLLSSPIEGVEFVREKSGTWLHCDMGDFGRVKCRVPEFVYGVNQFVARGGFEIVRPLKLPLTPVKDFLNSCKLDAAAKHLPDTIPLKNINILNKRGGLNRSQFQKLWGGKSLPAGIADCLGILADRTQSLPDRFKDYLRFQVPESLLFDMVLSTNGNIELSVSVQPGDPPIRFLCSGIVPTIMGPVPGLIGVELSKFSFGEVLSGALFTLKLDGNFHQFDIMTMASVLMIPSGSSGFLPDSRDLHRKIILDNLFMIIIYQTVIPVPIPVFYDELGFQYLGMEGVRLKNHFNFPQPRDPEALTGILQELYQFFSDKNYLLDAGKLPRGSNLEYTIGPNYLQLPAYMGNVLLGRDTDVGSMRTYENLAHFLNWLKTFRIDELIRAFPLDKRRGNIAINFFSLSLEVKWLVSCAKEFRERAYRELRFNKTEAEEALAILPGKAAKEGQGILVFLEGTMGLDKAAEFRCLLGLAAADGAGFATGFKINGILAEKLMKLELSGAVAVKPDNSVPVNVNGKSLLTILDKNILRGEVSIDDKGLFISGNLDLFPDSAIGIRGKIEGNFSNEEFLLKGDLPVKVGNKKLLNATAKISSSGIACKGTYLGREITLKVKELNKKPVLTADLKLSLDLTIDTGAVSMGSVKVTDGIKMDIVNALVELGLTIKESKFELSANVSFRSPVTKKKTEVGPLKLYNPVSSVRELAEEIEQFLKNNPEQFFMQLFSNAAEWLEGMAMGAISLAGDALKLSGKVLNKFYKKSSKAAAKLLKDAGYTAEQVGGVLKSSYDLGGDAAGEALKYAGYGAEKVAAVMKKTFNRSAKKVAKFMKKKWNKGDKAVEKLLKGAGFGKSAIKGAMKDIFGWFGGLL